MNNALPSEHKNSYSTVSVGATTDHTHQSKVNVLSFLELLEELLHCGSSLDLSYLGFAVM